MTDLDAVRSSAAQEVVSIVTPSFNQAQFLEETIESVVSQSYPDIEYMVVDGGSTDGSVDIIRRYSSQLAYWVSEPDRGQTHAINKGWQRATGGILAYLNSDDVYLPGAVRASADFLDAHPEVDLVYASALAMYPASNGGGPAMEPVEPQDFDLANLARLCYIPQPTVFFRRSLLERIGFLDESLEYCMDYDYWLRAALAGTIRKIPARTAMIRHHPDAKTSLHFSGFLKEDLSLFDRLSAMPAVDAVRAARIGYLFRLAPSGSLRGPHPPAERAQILGRLSKLTPRPSPGELEEAIAWYDERCAYLASGRQSDPRGEPLPVISDVSGSIASLVEAGLISVGEGDRLRRRVRGDAMLRALAWQAGRIRTGSAAATLLASAVWNPRLLARKRWWFQAGRVFRVNSVALPVYRAMRDQARTVIARSSGCGGPFKSS